MLIKKVIPQLLKIPTPYVLHKDLLMRSTFIGEVHLIQISQVLKIKQANIRVASTRFYSNKPIISKIKDTSEEAKKQKLNEKKKRDFIPKITLEDPQGNITVVTMAEASSLAQRRNLKLIYVREDSKSGRKEYKMVSSAEYLKSNLQHDLGKDSGEKSNDNAPKKVKISSISSKIGEADLNAKLKKMLQWIEKKHEIRVVINMESGDSSAAENVFKVIEKELKNSGRILQKLVKSDSLKFVILPPKETDQSSNEKKTKKGKTDKPEETESSSIQ